MWKVFETGDDSIVACGETQQQLQSILKYSAASTAKQRTRVLIGIYTYRYVLIQNRNSS